MDNESHLPTILRKKLPVQLEKIKNGYYTSEDFDYPIHKYLQDRNVMVDENGSEIVNFLKKKTILVTGATGFLGTLLVEKLLRSCKDIEKIYLIIRNKKGKTTETRIEEFLNDWVFIKLSEINPSFREKVIGINGDLEQFGLDLTKESRKLITDKVNIIYHVGATVRFDEKLRPSVMINLNGTKEIVQIAKECKKLDVLCHVSTAFANCNQRYVNEEFYQPFVEAKDLLFLTEHLCDETLDKLTSGLLGKLPNTYVFTKQIAEDFIRREAVEIPTCIVRPAIVLPTANEPIPIWTNSPIGAIGIIQTSSLGATHIIPGKADAIAHMIPADYVVNHCIAASYRTAINKKTNEIPIYNSSCFEINSVKWKQLEPIMKIQGMKIASKRVVFKSFVTFTKYPVIFKFLNFLLHYLPACLADTALFIFGKEPVYVKFYNKMMKFVDMIPYFALNEWTFDMTKTLELWSSLNEKDQKNFMFNMENFNFQDYFDISVAGFRELVQKEFLDKLDEGRAHYNKVVFISYFIMIAIPALSIYFLMNTIFSFIPITLICIILYYFISYIDAMI